ncbi:Smc5-6 complex non-SMC subunit Nse4 [Schizosaccharomyces cryophilus OY26]|uniref:Non-structural maintenance of chromosomes element 4 n=1 Tax=Schizosaccharomyces cryophilus (strain OY26 / ATCC MYA-4695 / CBS 11777 / NBRC 106824 / NRRL Y48691) TaxID=653667 RepID=S9XA86_SCHCR|nr:Smc5-6 complex non-SMC subunit Nse4 [Schizosaccharomyces cryophilus OY26]EPY50681.1 Smc5-6 complex non-SMC subunit Nse4 [Schizosaccharomyces cryophilus OY26]
MPPIDKRDLRKRYRSLINQVHESRLELVDQENNALIETVASANDLFSSVEAPTEAALDALLLTKTVDLASMRTKQLHIGKPKFNIELYIRQIKQFLSQNSSNAVSSQSNNHELAWSRLGKIAWKYQSRPASINLMVGPLSFRKKERQVQRREKLQRAPNTSTQPILLNQDNISAQENNTTKNVLQISRLLRKHQPIDLLKFITNPESYSQTVENLFYVSFLFKEGKAALIEDSLGALLLESKTPPSDEQVNSGEVRNVQLVMDMTLDLYEDIIRTFEITDSIIPTRRPVETAASSNTWYS